MSIITSKAIVFSSIKYGDSSLIVKCFTEKEGIKNYLIKGILKSKKGKLKPSYFQPLTQLELVGNHTNKGQLNYIKDIQIIHPYNSIHTSIVKQSIVIFLSEILSNVIQEEEANETLYKYLETSFIWLDTHAETANFHLLFLLNLSKFLGFYPDITNKHKSAFNLLEGKFTDVIYDKMSVNDLKLNAFRKLLNANFKSISDIKYTKNERQSILRLIIQYFELHLNGFKTPNSLEILESVFQ